MSSPDTAAPRLTMGTTWLPAILVLVALCYVVMAQWFGVASRTVPQLVGAVTGVLCLLDTVSRTDTPSGRAIIRWLNPAGEGEMVVAHRHRQTLAVAGLAMLALAMVLVGLLPAVALFGLLALRFRAGRGWLVSAGAGAGIALVIWVLFSLVLGLRLFPGLLFGGAW